jgi:hypothetical protein
MCAALSKYHALDDAAAAWARAAVFVIDLHVVIVFARLAPQVSIVVKGRAAVLNAIGEHADDTFAQ